MGHAGGGGWAGEAGGLTEGWKQNGWRKARWEGLLWMNAHPFLAVQLFDHWPTAVTTDSSIRGGCACHGLS